VLALKQWEEYYVDRPVAFSDTSEEVLAALCPMDQLRHSEGEFVTRPHALTSSMGREIDGETKRLRQARRGDGCIFGMGLAAE
jgi:hypothetical protein